MQNIMRFLFFTFLLSIVVACKTGKNLPIKNQPALHVTLINTDTLFKSQQSISILSVNQKDFSIGIGYNQEHLEKTSQIAERHNAIAAVNGGFFDMKKGGSVSYLEKNDSVISYSKRKKNKWTKSDSILNGILYFTKNRKLKIEAFKNDGHYKRSNREVFALVSGPLLLKKSTLQKLPNTGFTNLRHPRTFVCKTKDSIRFVVADGRAEHAAGMSLTEAQGFLKNLGCIDAINLDGGGSTTMWTKYKGVINSPSDKNGERSVANAILVLNKKIKSSNN